MLLSFFIIYLFAFIHYDYYNKLLNILFIQKKSTAIPRRPFKRLRLTLHLPDITESQNMCVFWNLCDAYTRSLTRNSVLAGTQKSATFWGKLGPSLREGHSSLWAVSHFQSQIQSMQLVLNASSNAWCNWVKTSDSQSQSCANFSHMYNVGEMIYLQPN